MNVLYIHQYFRTPAQGGGVRSFLNASAWTEAGHKVTMLTSPATMPSSGAERAQLRADLADQDIQLVICGPGYSSSMGLARRVLAFLGFAVMAAIWVLRNVRSYDVVYATSTPLTVAIPAMLGKLRGTPWVLEVRDVWPELPIAVGALKDPVTKTLARWLERTAYRSAAGVVALSPDMRDSIRRTWQSARILVVPNYSRADAPQQAKKATDKPHPPRALDTTRRWTLAYVGSLNWLNDVDYFIDMASCDDAEQFHFIVVGKGARRQEAERRINDEGLARRVTLVPAVGSDEALAYLQAADASACFFKPIKEMEANSANKFFSSLSVGTPVCINYGGWQAELLATSAAGTTLPPGDAEGGLDAIRRYLETTSAADRRHAASELSSQFEAKTGAKRIQTLLESVTR